MPNGDYLWRVDDHAQTYREIARHSRLDADVYDEYGRAMVEMGRFAKAILAMTPPDPLSMRVKDLRVLGALAKRFRDLPDTDRYHQLQLLTMSAVDFLDQWFETDVLKATMSASGIIGTFQGVRSPGTAYVLLHHYMGEIDGAFRSWGLSKGGTGQVSNAIAAAATAAGAEIRVNSAVRHILVSGNEATGVVLENGDYHMASVVLSSVDPRLTFLHMNAMKSDVRSSAKTAPCRARADISAIASKSAGSAARTSAAGAPGLRMTSIVGTRCAITRNPSRS